MIINIIINILLPVLAKKNVFLENVYKIDALMGGKRMVEQEAMDAIQSALGQHYPKAGARMNALFQEYEKGETNEARFVKDLDKLEMVRRPSTHPHPCAHRICCKENKMVPL